tara:strand:+ start:737 stop:1537 length:801 start_codon:yes stop_codon:yes gene_type:complete
MPDKKIILIGRNSFLSQNFSVFLKKKKIRFFIISYNNFMKLSHKRLKNYETILNFSINKDFVQKKYALKNDLDLKIAKKIKDVNVRLVVFSTSKVYKSASNIKETSLKNPLTNYGKNKLKSESSLKKILSNYVILRISNIIGRKLRKNKRSVTNTFFDIVRLNLKKKKIVVPEKNFFKDFIFIEDFCIVLHKILTKKIKGTYNLSSGKKTYLHSIAKMISQYTKIPITLNKEKTDSFTLSNLKLFKVLKINYKLKQISSKNLKSYL